MTFASFGFLFGFLPAAILTTWTARRRNAQWAISMLIVASVLFYGWNRPSHLWILAGSLAWNYTLGSRLLRQPQKMLLGIAVGGNLLALIGIKIAAMSFDDTGTGSVLPLGISFIIIQQITYLADAYRGAIDRENFTEYILLICFFPRILAGPIVRWQEFAPQLRSARFCTRTDDVIIGWSIVLVGLGKKVVLADTFGKFSDAVFALTTNGAVPPPYYAWGGVIAFGLQLYFDFSGYSDMALGLARMYGITLPENFLAPYRAENIADFWRRWHISLYRFLRDSIYIPLGGNRHGTLGTVRNIFAVTLCAGLWHGIAWTFIVWGMLHGAFLSIHTLWKWKNHLFRLPPMLSTTLTVLCVLVAWVPFRSTSITATLRMYRGMIGQTMDTSTGPLLSVLDIQGWEHAPWWIAGGILLVYCFPTTQHIFRSYDPVLREKPIMTPVNMVSIPAWQPTVLWGVALAIMTMIALHALAWHTTPFLYFQF